MMIIQACMPACIYIHVCDREQRIRDCGYIFLLAGCCNSLINLDSWRCYGYIFNIYLHSNGLVINNCMPEGSGCLKVCKTVRVYVFFIFETWRQ